MRKLRRLAVWTILLVAALGAGAFFVRRDKGASEETYRTEAVDRGDVTMTVTATGTISAVTTVQVGSQVSGIIARLHADFNSPVDKGQLLAELDPTPFQARVEQRRADLVQAEVQMRNAQVMYGRQERLLREGLAATADYDTAKANYEAAEAQVAQARATLEQAETDLRYTRIVSPIDGVVVARQYDVGQTVAASFQAPTLFTIAQDLTKMQVQADVDQSDIGRIATGQPARFTVDAYPEQEFHGQITQIRLNATVNQNVITYPVMISVPNPDDKLRPQMTANVSIEVATVRDVLRVPNAALRFRPTGPSRGEGRASAGGEGGREPPAGGAGEKARGFAAVAAQFDAAVGGSAGRRGQSVYLLAGPDQLERVGIRTGISDGRYTQVLDGEIEPGDRVVVGQATSKVETTARPPGAGGRFF